MGLEVSRLARNSADWHRLIELCSMAGTLILDEDGLYDPAAFNDRLLLGLKGELSQAELHFLKARMRGGVLNKARRGELEMGCPLAWSICPTGVLGSILIRKFGPPYSWCSTPLSAPARQCRRSAFFVRREFGSRAGFVRALKKENCCGASRTIVGSSRFCTTHVTRAPSSMAALAAAANRMASTPQLKCRGRNGSFSSATAIRATSPGIGLRRIKSGC